MQQRKHTTNENWTVSQYRKETRAINNMHSFLQNLKRSCKNVPNLKRSKAEERGKTKPIRKTFLKKINDSEGPENMHKPAKDQSSQETHVQAEFKKKRKDSQNYQRQTGTKKKKKQYSKINESKKQRITAIKAQETKIKRNKKE